MKMSQHTENTQEPVDDDLVGSFLKFAKGVWTLDDGDIAVGPAGFRMTVFVPTARHGRVLWEDGRITERITQKYSDGDPAFGDMPDGWNAYTSFQAIADGEIITFRSSSWSARGRKRLSTASTAIARSRPAKRA
jgi:hypothetical protein